MIPHRIASSLVALAALASLAADAPPRSRLDFDREVRPVLAEHCFPCHGPDAGKRKANFRLDTKQGAFALRDGRSPIIPGKPDESELALRVGSDNPDDMMPPPVHRQRKQFSTADAEVLRRWVAEGAEYKGHWAFEKTVKTSPSGQGDPIDQFILSKLAEQGLKPSAPADRVTLIRRLSFDVTGLPPTPEEVDAFVNDKAPNAYENVVDRLLASPHYGERMAIAWLDWVRFGDTAGYHSDNHRDVWLYRDYVIDAFNTNVPFDRFTTEQLAGDLLPGATRKQRIGSGYNRMLQTTEEGGAQAKEYTAKYAADRVRNASSVWLGLTLGCAECHDHKFDPFTTRDFYRFAAFFADVQEVAVGRQPATKMPTPDQKAKLAALDSKAATMTKTLETTTPELVDAQSAWEKEARATDGRWTTLVPTSAKSEGGTPLKIEADGTILAQGKAAESDVYTLTFQVDRRAITALRLDVLSDSKMPAGGPGRAANGNFVLNDFAATIAGQPVGLANASASYSQPSYDVVGAIDGDPQSGWAVMGNTGRSSHAVFETRTDFGDAKPFPLTVRLTQRYGGQHVTGRFRLSVTEAKRPVKAGGGDTLPAAVRGALAIEPGKRSKEQAEAVAGHYRPLAPALEPTRQAIAALNRERDAIVAAAPEALVTTSTSPRSLRILPRGNWLDDSGQVVTPAVPASLGPEIQNRRATRLDLARWLVGADNPLVARVFVNRAWKIAFGQGLVTSVEDFGSQGASPSHPELLDWLAVTFRDEGWDVKRLMKGIVMTEAYRRASSADPAHLQSDPYNRWLARQGRFRLDAEFVRDDMLVVSGLFAPKVGGPSVKPYQPEGYWAHLNFPRREYTNDHGEPLYRRGMYTYWQRSFLHPSLLAFDAPSREECTANRPRSNTPLQALVLLNDPIFVEGARAFAEKAIHEAGKDDEARLTFAYTRALSRPPRPDERAILLSLLAKHRDHYGSHAKEAEEFLRVGERPPAKDIPAAELAAWTSVARAILNLHETITRN